MDEQILIVEISKRKYFTGTFKHSTFKAKAGVTIVATNMLEIKKI